MHLKAKLMIKVQISTIFGLSQHFKRHNTLQILKNEKSFQWPIIRVFTSFFGVKKRPKVTANQISSILINQKFAFYGLKRPVHEFFKTSL